MASSLSALRTAVTDAIGNSQPIALRQTDLAINYAQMIAALFFDPPELHTYTTISLGIGASSASLTGFARLNCIENVYNSTGVNKVWPIPWTRWQILTAVAATGTPKYFSRQGNILHTYPTPIASTTLYVYYKQYPSLLSNAGDTLSFDNYDSFIVPTAIKLVWAFQEEPEAVDVLAKVGESIGIPLTMGTQLRRNLEEGISGKYDLSGTHS